MRLPTFTKYIFHNVSFDNCGQTHESLEMLGATKISAILILHNTDHISKIENVNFFYHFK